MTDLTTRVPDTSKYTDPADRLIALGLAVKSDKELQFKTDEDTSWRVVDREATGLLAKCRSVLSNLAEYRSKHEPNVMWAVLENGGNFRTGEKTKESADALAKFWESNDKACAPYRVVRFVESTDDQ